MTGHVREGAHDVVVELDRASHLARDWMGVADGGIFRAGGGVATSRGEREREREMELDFRWGGTRVAILRRDN